VVSTEEGTPQGGPLSPLLSNIVLDELDCELSNRGHHFVRYADDCNIYVRSERSGKRVMAGLVWFIERRLRLKVNLAKSAVARPEERHFLGFRLRREPTDGEVEVLLSKRTKTRIDERVLELTPRMWGQSLKDCLRKLNAYLQGWIGYFWPCTEVEARTLHNLDAHIRRRLRVLLLRQWKQRRNIVRPHPAGNTSQTHVGEHLPWTTVLVGAQPQLLGAMGPRQDVLRWPRARIPGAHLGTPSLPARQRPTPARAGDGIAVGGNTDVELRR
jgi:hypothetical protein